MKLLPLLPGLQERRRSNSGDDGGWRWGGGVAAPPLTSPVTMSVSNYGHGVEFQ